MWTQFKISASDVAACIGLNPYQSKDEMLAKYLKRIDNDAYEQYTQATGIMTREDRTLASRKILHTIHRDKMVHIDKMVRGVNQEITQDITVRYKAKIKALLVDLEKVVQSPLLTQLEQEDRMVIAITDIVRESMPVSQANVVIQMIESRSPIDTINPLLPQPLALQFEWIDIDRIRKEVASSTKQSYEKLTNQPRHQLIAMLKEKTSQIIQTSHMVDTLGGLSYNDGVVSTVAKIVKGTDDPETLTKVNTIIQNIGMAGDEKYLPKISKTIDMVKQEINQLEIPKEHKKTLIDNARQTLYTNAGNACEQQMLDNLSTVKWTWKRIGQIEGYSNMSVILVGKADEILKTPSGQLCVREFKTRIRRLFNRMVPYDRIQLLSYLFLYDVQIGKLTEEHNGVTKTYDLQFNQSEWDIVVLKLLTFAKSVVDYSQQKKSSNLSC